MNLINFHDLQVGAHSSAWLPSIFWSRQQWICQETPALQSQLIRELLQPSRQHWSWPNLRLHWWVSHHQLPQQQQCLVSSTQQWSVIEKNNIYSAKIIDNCAGIDDDYTNNLRSSSYAMLKPAEVGQGPKSLMPSQEHFHLSSTTPASLFQSLPYIGGGNQVIVSKRRLIK